MPVRTGAELRHPHEHVDAQLLRPAEVQREQPVLQQRDAHCRPVAVDHGEEDEQGRRAHQERDDPFLQMIEHFHRVAPCCRMEVGARKPLRRNPQRPARLNYSLLGSKPVAL
jgi:hypothetical protein